MEWYYLRDGRTMGPGARGSIRAWLESGFLVPEDLLWRAGMTQWLPVVELTEFGGSGGAEQAVGPDQERLAWDDGRPGRAETGLLTGGRRTDTPGTPAARRTSGAGHPHGAGSRRRPGKVLMACPPRRLGGTPSSGRRAGRCGYRHRPWPPKRVLGSPTRRMVRGTHGLCQHLGPCGRCGYQI